MLENPNDPYAKYGGQATDEEDPYAKYNRDPNAAQHFTSTHFARGSAGQKAQYAYQHRTLDIAPPDKFLQTVGGGISSLAHTIFDPPGTHMGEPDYGRSEE